MEKFYFVFRRAVCFRSICNCSRRRRRRRRTLCAQFQNGNFSFSVCTCLSCRAAMPFGCSISFDVFIFATPKNKNSIETESIRSFFVCASISVKTKSTTAQRQRAIRTFSFLLVLFSGQFYLSFDFDSFDHKFDFFCIFSFLFVSFRMTNAFEAIE